MRIVSAFLLGLALIFCVSAVADAQKEGKKEITLKGEICCPKCELGTDNVCGTVVVVTKNDKKTVYYFDADAHKKYHKEICTECKKGEVTGVVGGDDKKRTIKVKEVKFE
jgi:uncharacterized protein DUF6370